MRMRLALSLLFAIVCADTIAAQPPGMRVTCEGGGGMPKWAARVTAPNKVRFTIDATLVDTCTIYSKIEFVAKLLDKERATLETRRFSLPGVVIRGPSFASYDFELSRAQVAGVEGVSLNVEKRIIGGLPANTDKIDTATQLGMKLFEESKEERSKYEEWLLPSAPDFSETQILGTDQKVCVSGTLSITEGQGNRGACAEVQKRADEIAAERAAKFGAQILPAEHLRK